MSSNKRLPINISNFKMMIEGGYLYVDKTEVIFNLLKKRLLFLSRPRRFGKSLLVSTLKELFSGSKKLFEDTWIGKQKDYHWPEHPVIYLDFSNLGFDTSVEFKNDLIWALKQIGDSYGVDISSAPSLITKFKFLIDQLAQKNRVVVLIDEYDAPLLNNLESAKIAKAIQKTMKSFFSVIKSADASGFIEAVFITGVTKFAKTSIFSGLNNLSDITLRPEAADLLGYTERDLRSYFGVFVDKFSSMNNISASESFCLIKDWYNGYRFSKDDIRVYNPYSVVHCFENNEIENYWLESGTPLFLIELLKNQYKSLEDIEKDSVDVDFLGMAFDIGRMPLIPILFQTGYLTIERYNPKLKTYGLNYPNKEVGDSFKKYVIEALTQMDAHKIGTLINSFQLALENNDTISFFEALRSLFANIPHHIHLPNEAYYHSLLHVILDLMGHSAQSEIASSNGRIDLVINDKNRVYLFELKFKGSGKRALEQILDRRYFEKYLRLKKPIVLIGLSFNVKNRELSLDWVKKELQN